MRTLIRRGSVTAFLPVLVALQLFVVLHRGTPWLGEWDWTVDWAAGATVLTGPLLAGCTAFELLRWRSAVTWSLVRSTRRAGSAAWRVTAGAFAVGAAVHVVAAASMLIATRAVGAEPTPESVLPLVMPLLVLGASASIGAFIVSCWRSLLAVPLAAAIVFGVTTFPGGLPAVFRVGGTSGSLVGLTWEPRHLWSSAAVLLSLTVLLATVVRARDLARGSVTSRAVVMVAGVALAVSVVAAKAAPADFLARSDRPIRYECITTEATSVCLASGTSRQLPWLAEQIVRQSQPLRALGVVIPRRYQQDVPYRDLRPGTAPIYLQADGNAPTGDPAWIPRLLVVPTQCSADTAGEPPPAQVFGARAAMAAWLGVANHVVRPADLADEPYADWLRSDPAQQADWIRTTFDQLRDCRYDEVRLPDGVLPAGGVASY